MGSKTKHPYQPVRIPGRGVIHPRERKIKTRDDRGRKVERWVWFWAGVSFDTLEEVVEYALGIGKPEKITVVVSDEDEEDSR